MATRLRPFLAQQHDGLRARHRSSDPLLRRNRAHHPNDETVTYDLQVAAAAGTDGTCSFVAQIVPSN